MKSFEDFFTNNEDYHIRVYYYENINSFTVEQLYQAIKARLISEIQVKIPNTGFIGRLEEK